MVYGESVLKVTGTVEGSDVKIELNGEEIFISGKVFTGYVKNLSEGQHTIGIVGTDFLGEEIRITRTFTIDLTPPKL